MDGRTNKSPPVFYRTSSPSGPLPCFLFNFKHNLLRQGMGTADHLKLWRIFELKKVSRILVHHPWLKYRILTVLNESLKGQI